MVSKPPAEHDLNNIMLQKRKKNIIGHKGIIHTLTYWELKKLSVKKYSRPLDLNQHGWAEEWDWKWNSVNFSQASSIVKL